MTDWPWRKDQSPLVLACTPRGGTYRSGRIHAGKSAALLNDMPVYTENWFAAGAMYSTAADLINSRTPCTAASIGQKLPGSEAKGNSPSRYVCKSNSPERIFERIGPRNDFRFLWCAPYYVHVSQSRGGRAPNCFIRSSSVGRKHFRFQGYGIEVLTAIARATVVTLDLNHSRPQRIRQVEEAFGL